MPKIVATYWRPLLLVFLPFSAGYFLSYFFRTINAVLATALTNELGLNVSELGLMTAVYFLTFAITNCRSVFCSTVTGRGAYKASFSS